MTIYKYLAPQRVDVLSNARLRCTPPDELNDPHEARPVITSTLPEVRAQTAFDEMWPQIVACTDFRPVWINRFVPERLIAFLFRRVPALHDTGNEALDTLRSMINSGLLEKVRQLQDHDFDPLRRAFGILSFSKRADCPVMWAHYAAEHSGFVVGYSEGHPVFSGSTDPQDFIGRLLPVQYIDAGTDAHEALGLTAFFMKSRRWSHEEEVRMVMHLDDHLDRVDLPTGTAVHLLRVPPEAVESVTYGARSSSDLVSTLRTTLSRPDYQHVRVFRAAVSSSAFRVDALPVDDA